MRAWANQLVAISVIAAFGLGCASHDGAEGERTEHPGGSTADPVRDDCPASIDAQISAGEIPNADREYFVGMCEAFG